jgi:hypothetical protein
MMLGVLCILCALAGIARPPASGGNRRLTIGTSSKSDVERALGTASIFKVGSGDEVWVYQSRHAMPGIVRHLPVVNMVAPFIHSHTDEVVLLFGADGVLKKFRVIPA